MTGKLTLLIGFGAGYMLGARSGRERYDQIADKVQELWRDPAVQDKVGQAQQVVQEKTGQAGQAVKEKVGTTTSSDGSGASTAAATGTGAGPLP
jgi:hypothetical protein